MRARFYNPLIRRFVNADPAQQGWNWYAYAAGNPLGFVDPTGLGNQGVLDAVQTGLSFLGMVPVVGFVADIANAGISVARGNYAGAALDLTAAIPGIGQAAGAAKIAGASFGMLGAIRTADRVGDFGRALTVNSRIVTNSGGSIRSFVTQTDQTFYRVFSGNRRTGGFLTAVPPRSSAYAREALALPSSNLANLVQEVNVPAGTRLQRSRTLPAFGRRGGGEQFELLDKLSSSAFGIGRKLD